MKMNWMLRSVLAILAVGALMVTGCEDDDDDDVNSVAGTGRLTVRGNVVAFNEGDAPAAVAGGKVYLEGTDIEAELGADGTFTFTGVPAGTYTAVFEFDGITGALEIVVKDGFWLEIRNVTVYEDGTVQAQIIYHPVGESLNVAGNWLVTRIEEPKPQPLSLGPSYTDVFTIRQNGGTLSGTMVNILSLYSIVEEEPTYPTYNLNGSINGSQVSLTATYLGKLPAGEWPPITFTGQANSAGTYISGEWTEGEKSGTWTAVPGTLDTRE